MLHKHVLRVEGSLHRVCILILNIVIIIIIISILVIYNITYLHLQHLYIRRRLFATGGE